MWNTMMGSTGALPWMIAGQVVIWIAVIVGLVLIVREISRALQARQERPLATLQRRLARGEISRDDYETVRQILTQPDVREMPTAPPAPQSTL